MTTKFFLNAKKLEKDKKRIDKKIRSTEHLTKLVDGHKRGCIVFKKIPLRGNKLEFFNHFDEINDVKDMMEILNLSKARCYEILHDLDNYEVGEIK